MVLAELIQQYLKSNRRLVIPELGAFLVKESDQRILFSPLLKRDDGVLRELLLESGLKEMEVEVLINRLLFEVRYAVENADEYILVGLGSFKGDGGGSMIFTEWSEVEKTIAEQDAVAETSEDIAESTESAVEQPAMEPAVEPLFEAESEPQSEESEPEPVTERKVARESAHRKQRSSLDVWLVVAIAVAVLALGSILYGFLLERSQGNFAPDYQDYTVVDDSKN